MVVGFAVGPPGSGPEDRITLQDLSPFPNVRVRVESITGVNIGLVVRVPDCIPRSLPLRSWCVGHPVADHDRVRLRESGLKEEGGRSIRQSRELQRVGIAMDPDGINGAVVRPVHGVLFPPRMKRPGCSGANDHQQNCGHAQAQPERFAAPMGPGLDHLRFVTKSHGRRKIRSERTIFNPEQASGKVTSGGTYHPE